MSNNRNITQLPVNSNLSTIEGFAAVDISGANVQISGQSIIDSIDAVTSVLSSNTALLTVTGGNVPTITVNTAPITKGGTGLATADQIVTYIATQTGTSTLQGVLENGSTATIEEIISIESVDENLSGRLNISTETSSMIQSRSSATSNRNEKIVLLDGEIEIEVENSSGEASIEMEVKGVNDRKDTMSISSNSGTYIVSYPVFTAPDYNVYPRSELQINKDTLTLKYQEQDYDDCEINLLPGYIQLKNNTNIDNPDPAVTVNNSSIDMGEGNIQLQTINSNTATPAINGEAEFILSPNSTRSEWKQTKIINGPQPVEVFNSIAFETEAMQLVNDWGNGDGRCKIELRDALIEVSTENDDDPSGLGLGIRYAEDYSANFVTESLITKRYVDTQIAAQDLQSVMDQGATYLGTNDFTIKTAPSTGTNSAYISTSGNKEIVVTSNDGNVNGTRRSELGLQGNTIILSRFIPSTANPSAIQKIMFIGDFPVNYKMEVEDRAGSKGLEYAGPYKANFTQYSLVDKDYVDTQIANQSAKRFDFDGNFLVYPVIFSLGVAPESTEAILQNPTLQDIENANTINTEGDNLMTWVDLVVAGECGALKQVLTLAINKTAQILQDLASEEEAEAEGYEFLQTQYETFINDGQNANPPVDVSGLQSVLADITTARNVSNALYVETVQELEQLKQTYQQIVSLADNQCGNEA